MPKNRINVTKNEEDPYHKIRRERREKEARELADKKQAEKDALKEKKRAEKVIKSYLDKLEVQIKEKNLLNFWSFPDVKGFKKIWNFYNYKQIDKVIQDDLDKYANRQVMRFHITFSQNESVTSLARTNGNWFTVHMMLFEINNKGDIKNTNSCHYAWRNGDFKITKFSFKLLETIMYPIANHIHGCASILGIPLWNVIEQLQLKGVDFTDVLKPLAKA
jgi:hypothetical protein